MKKAWLLGLTGAFCLSGSACGGGTTTYQLGAQMGTYPTPTVTTSKVDETSTALYFLNVCTLSDFTGQGDCIVIADRGTITVIDAGNNTEGTAKEIKTLLNDLGATKIDHLILTHAHSDHSGVMDELIRYYDIGTLYLKPTDWEKKVDNPTEAESEYTRIYQEIQRKQNADGSYPLVNTVNTNELEIVLQADSSLTLYYSETVYGDENAYDYNYFSMAMTYRYKDFSAYLGGDATSTLTDELAGQIGDVDILKVAHHGSNGPYTTAAFLDEIQPEYAIVTGNQAHLKSDPKALLDEREIPYGFVGDGTITITTDGTTYTKKQ